jgi:hypothetical protein
MLHSVIKILTINNDFARSNQENRQSTHNQFLTIEFSNGKDKNNSLIGIGVKLLPDRLIFFKSCELKKSVSLICNIMTVQIFNFSERVHR